MRRLVRSEIGIGDTVSVYRLAKDDLQTRKRLYPLPTTTRASSNCIVALPFFQDKSVNALSIDRGALTVRSHRSGGELAGPGHHTPALDPWLHFRQTGAGGVSLAGTA